MGLQWLKTNVLQLVQSAAIICVPLALTPVTAQDSLVTIKSMSPEIALDLARTALADCRQRGYQVAVAVVDRFDVIQVMLRDRFADPHTPATAIGKAWTAVSFRTNTTDLVAASQPRTSQAGVRNLPGATVIGGGKMTIHALSQPSSSAFRRELLYRSCAMGNSTICVGGSDGIPTMG